MIIRYLDFVERLEWEIIQREDEGLHVLKEKVLLQNLRDQSGKQSVKNIQSDAEQILQRLSSVATPSAISNNEPNELAEIKKCLPSSRFSVDGDIRLNEEELYNSILGAWLGRSAGCLLGKPIERYHRTVIREMLESNNSWPLNNYFTQVGMPQELLKKYPWKRRWGLESLRENIKCMPEDDDLNFTMLNLHVLETFGPEFTSEDVATTWLNKLPVNEVFTAERVAYNNLLNGHSPPESGQYLNPFREWIGAQIRADLWGYVCPGNPAKAAEFAWRDARITHTRTGIYGEMFFAAVMAAAFVEKDLRKLMRIGLEQIPAESRFSMAMEKVLEIPIETTEWETVVDTIYAYFDNYHWVHTINNAALTIASVIHGQGNYEQTICNAVMGGWDTDCNGATAGSIVGIVRGANQMPEKWVKPLNNKIRSSLGGFDYSEISDLARRTAIVARGAVSIGKASEINESDDF